MLNSAVISFVLMFAIALLYVISKIELPVLV